MVTVHKEMGLTISPDTVRVEDRKLYLIEGLVSAPTSMKARDYSFLGILILAPYLCLVTTIKKGLHY